MKTLQVELAPRIAPVVLANITTRYPYHDAHLFHDGETPVDPTNAHPAFGNSFDWHSSVHSHWTAVQLLEHFETAGGTSPIVERLQDAVERNLSADNLAAEQAYLAARPTYERPYGWAWAMMLAAGADAARVVGLQPIRAPLRDLAQQVGSDSMRWLDTLPSPIRHGVHGNTAFALGLMLDASQALKFTELERAICDHVGVWFSQDRDYPAAWERSGYDFLSPGLAEADLMRRVLAREEFRVWWRGFFPDTNAGSTMLAVVEVPKVRDGQVAHLHGLNLSRAGMLARIAVVVESGELLEHAERLYRAGIGEAVGSDYLSTHWLPTFAWDAASSIDASADEIKAGPAR